MNGKISVTLSTRQVIVAIPEQSAKIHEFRLKVKPLWCHISPFIIFSSEAQLQLASEKTRKWARRPVAFNLLHTQQKQKHHAHTNIHLNQGALQHSVCLWCMFAGCCCGVDLKWRLLLPASWRCHRAEISKRRAAFASRLFNTSSCRQKSTTTATKSLRSCISLSPSASSIERKQTVLCWSRGYNPWMDLTRGQKQNNLSQREVFMYLKGVRFERNPQIQVQKLNFYE